MSIIIFTERNEKVRYTSTEYIIPNEKQPFKVREDAEMFELMDSIKTNGVLNPIIVRSKNKEEGDYYEIVSGHRRFKACEKLGISRVPVIVRDLTDDEAIVCNIDSNLHREHLLPSEKAYAYKAKMEVLNRQGQRNLNMGKDGGFDSAKEIGKAMNESRDQVYRYIRLTNLTKPLMDLVDEGRIAFTPAVELSTLTPKLQSKIVEIYERDETTPSYSQSVKLRKLFNKGKLTDSVIEDIMSKRKANQKEFVKIELDRIADLFPENYTPKQISESIILILQERKIKSENKKEIKNNRRVSIIGEIEKIKSEVKDEENKIEERGVAYEK